MIIIGISLISKVFLFNGFHRDFTSNDAGKCNKILGSH